MKITNILLYIILAFYSLQTNAQYNANMSGVVTQVLFYSDGDSILFRLDNQPGSHPACNTDYFTIGAEVPLERRKFLAARLLMAKMTKEKVNIGYDSIGDCAADRIRVHRVG